jgi:hypothetical protein
MSKSWLQCIIARINRAFVDAGGKHINQETNATRHGEKLGTTPTDLSVMS